MLNNEDASNMIPQGCDMCGGDAYQYCTEECMFFIFLFCLQARANLIVNQMLSINTMNPNSTFVNCRDTFIIDAHICTNVFDSGKNLYIFQSSSLHCTICIKSSKYQKFRSLGKFKNS